MVVIRRQLFDAFFFTLLAKGRNNTNQITKTKKGRDIPSGSSLPDIIGADRTCADRSISSIIISLSEMLF
jgi:hypothetical protein